MCSWCHRANFTSVPKHTQWIFNATKVYNNKFSIKSIDKVAERHMPLWLTHTTMVHTKVTYMTLALFQHYIDKWILNVKFTNESYLNKWTFVCGTQTFGIENQRVFKCWNCTFIYALIWITWLHCQCIGSRGVNCWDTYVFMLYILISILLYVQLHISFVSDSLKGSTISMCIAHYHLMDTE